MVPPKPNHPMQLSTLTLHADVPSPGESDVSPRMSVSTTHRYNGQWNDRQARLRGLLPKDSKSDTAKQGDWSRAAGNSHIYSRDSSDTRDRYAR